MRPASKDGKRPATESLEQWAAAADPDPMTSRRPLLSVALGSVCLFSACGGDMKPTTVSFRGLHQLQPGQRMVLGPKTFPNFRSAFPPILRAGRKVGVTDPSRAPSLLIEGIHYVDAHCPCTVERTRTGFRILSERHP